jgi:predicted MFS family arabinose efflux permease
MVLANPLAGRAADRGRTRALVVAAFGVLALVYLGLELTSTRIGALPLALAAACLVGIPLLAGNVLLSRSMSAGGIDQTVSQTLATLAWAPAAIAGSVSAGVISSPDVALIVLAVAAGCAACLAALEHTQRQRPQPA